MATQSNLQSSSTPAVTATSSSSITITATTTTNVPVTTSTTGTTMAHASISATRAATAALSGASTTPASSSQESDEDVPVMGPPPLVANVSQFYDDDGNLRDVKTTALWRSQVQLPFQVFNVTYSFLVEQALSNLVLPPAQTAAMSKKIKAARPTTLTDIALDPKTIKENWELDEETVLKKTKSKKGRGRGWSSTSEATIPSKKRGAVNILMADKPRKVQKSDPIPPIKSKPVTRSSRPQDETQSHSKSGVDPSGVEAEVTQPPKVTVSLRFLSPIQPTPSTAAFQASTGSPMASYMPFLTDAETHQESGPVSTSAIVTLTILPHRNPANVEQEESPINVPALEAQDLNFDDFDFDLENILSEARKVYSSEGTKVKISTDALMALETFIENIYNHIAKAKAVEKKFNTTIEALASHDKQLKKCEIVKSQIEEVSSEGRSKEKILATKFDIMEKELAELKANKAKINFK
ncbi:cell wall integrity and stress response component 4-like [Arachis stenosperma]|uniref:cell wall integrity and stress response component 4-like n=1 Tax=Arachis stenosperma TaxID=217475 RepID=UPI0025AC12D7|nr:cell wall integrity and stress response component 4-like [Arachis stenosperma]